MQLHVPCTIAQWCREKSAEKARRTLCTTAYPSFSLKRKIYRIRKKMWASKNSKSAALRTEAEACARTTGKDSGRACPYNQRARPNTAVQKAAAQSPSCRSQKPVTTAGLAERDRKPVPGAPRPCSAGSPPQGRCARACPGPSSCRAPRRGASRRPSGRAPGS